MRKILYPMLLAIGLLFVYGVLTAIQRQRMISFEIGGPDGLDSYETFEQSTKQEQREGASKYYKWFSGGSSSSGANDSSRSEPARTHRQKTECPECKHGFDILIQLPDSFMKPQSCENADITKNKDIDKYVLKSSVPPCPDMTDYVRKSELPPREAHDLRNRVAAHTKGKREHHHYLNRAEDKPNTALPPADQYYEPKMATGQGQGQWTSQSQGQGQDQGQQAFSPDFQENDYGGYTPYNAMIPSMS